MRSLKEYNNGCLANKPTQETAMNHDTKATGLPELTANLLRDGDCLVDNLFADLWKQLSMKSKLNRLGFHKRSGAPANEVVYALMVWVWLKVNSVGMFARESLKTYSQASKDALYAALNHEDWNWRRLNLEIAQQTMRALKVSVQSSAFALDDSIKMRSGKKMPGVSSHFDHTSGRCVMGQQVLTLGISSAEGFVPVDSELFISGSKARALHQPFRDGRSVAAKRYKVAVNQTKPQMAGDMIRRAQRAGIDALYILADAWFGTKAMINMACERLLIPIYRMKKNTMKYRLTECRAGKFIHREMDLNSLFHHCIRGQWQKIAGQPYQAKTLDVELNLNKQEETEKWIKVRLLFVRGMVEQDKTQVGKHDWAAFLTTDLSLTPQRILELYAMRWAIEVYFKEAKQHLGFLQEQSNHYAAYVASIHLTAIRFCMLVIGKAQGYSDGISAVRNQIIANATAIDHATRLWHVFHAVIAGALDELKTELGDMLSRVMETIERHVENFFVQSLQLDIRTLRLEAK
jgi:DDE superfamily endonuclease